MILPQVGSKDSHRGFAFVDFCSLAEARRAFDSLVHSTHLYGRRLVLEWADDDDSVETLRVKAQDAIRFVLLLYLMIDFGK